MLALKLLLVPLFLGLVSLAGKRWGPGIAGWLAGFPIVTGPILLLLALEKGTAFAAQAAAASLSAVFASVAFSLAYCWVCLRKPWLHSLLAGAALTLAVTSLSAVIGASWSGLLAVFPLLGIVLAVFSQRACGAAFVVAMLRAMVSGLYSFVTFCFLLALLLQSRGIAASFVIAIMAAIAVQSVMKMLLARRASGTAPAA